MNGRLLLLLLTFRFCPVILAQTTQIQANFDKNNDSSFYSICQISKNEFWIAGENGILFHSDSNANLTRSKLNLEGCTILKMAKQDPFVFMITDSQVIFRYHLPSSKLEKFTIARFRKKCFYDIALLPNGKILLCGGNKQVARVKKCIPNGFIAETDTSLNQIKTTWKNARKFVWSLASHENEVFASTYNGINSKIIQHKKSGKWRKYKTIKGIAYRIYKEDSGFAAIGAASLEFRKNGTIQNLMKRKVLPQSGCIWNRRCIDDKIYFVSNNGELISSNRTLDSVETRSIKQGFPIYDFQKISSNTWMFTGHGKSIFFRQWN